MTPWTAWASQPHYADHLAPIWLALDPDERGRFHVAGSRVRRHVVERLGIDPSEVVGGVPRPQGGQVLVASQGDAYRVRRRACALVEHGAGQAYDIEHGAYSGGPGRDNVVLFLCPNEVSADRNRERYPEAAAEVVGSARLDALRARAAQITVRPSGTAMSFHWACPLSPEAGWALDHYRNELPAVKAHFGDRFVGHGHPRYPGFFAQLWRDLGVLHAPWFPDLLRLAYVYVCDNSSSMYEWAALGRPVVVLNSPAYRRDIDLWPRFWRCADVGVQVDEPEALVDAMSLAAADPPAVARRRAEVAAEVFPHQDGRAAERSVGALRRISHALRSAS